MLTIKQTAKELNVSERQIFRYISQGYINAIKLGRLTRINENEIEKIKLNGITYCQNVSLLSGKSCVTAHRLRKEKRLWEK